MFRLELGECPIWVKSRHGGAFFCFTPKSGHKGCKDYKALKWEFRQHQGKIIRVSS